MGVQRHNIPHFKGLIVLDLDFEAQGRGSTFTFCHAHLKKAILLHKMARVPFDLDLAIDFRNGFTNPMKFGPSMFHLNILPNNLHNVHSHQHVHYFLD